MDGSHVSRCSNTRVNEHASDRPAVAEMGFFLKHMKTRQTFIEGNSINSMVKKKKKKSLCIVDSRCNTNLTVSLLKQQRIVLATLPPFSGRHLFTHCCHGSLSKARAYLIFVLTLSSPGIWYRWAQIQHFYFKQWRSFDLFPKIKVNNSETKNTITKFLRTYVWIWDTGLWDRESPGVFESPSGRKKKK